MTEKKHHKKKPRKIITTRHDDNTYSHEHVHDDDGKEGRFAGTSADVDDLKQHMEDHFGGGDGGDEEVGAAQAAPEAAPAAGE